MGQYVYDLPVSTEISVKGGKGIWGMPKHQANLDFQIGTADGLEPVRPRRPVGDAHHHPEAQMDRAAPAHAIGQLLPVPRHAVQVLDLLPRTDRRVGSFHRRAADLVIGDHPRAAPLRQLDVGSRPLLTAYFPASAGILDDHIEGWFLGFDEPPSTPPEGLESVVDLALSESWLAPPKADGRG